MTIKTIKKNQENELMNGFIPEAYGFERKLGFCEVTSQDPG